MNSELASSADLVHATSSAYGLSTEQEVESGFKISFRHCSSGRGGEKPAHLAIDSLC